MILFWLPRNKEITQSVTHIVQCPHLSTVLQHQEATSLQLCEDTVIGPHLGNKMFHSILNRQCNKTIQHVNIRFVIILAWCSQRAMLHHALSLLLDE